MHCMETSARNCPSVDRLALITCVWSFEGEQALSQVPVPPPLLQLTLKLSMAAINL